MAFTRSGVRSPLSPRNQRQKEPPKGGFFVWATLPPGEHDERLLARCLPHGVIFVAGSAFYVDGTGHDTIRLSFSAPGVDRIREGVKRLAAAMQSPQGPV